MRTIPVELQQELLEEVTAVQYLITIVTKSHTYRWTDGQSNVYYGGNWWESKGITFDRIGSTLTGQLDSFTLEIDNTDSAFSDLVLGEDIRGSQCTLSIVYLDDNQTVIGEPIVVFQGFTDRTPVDKTKGSIEVFSHFVRWKLITPRRQHTPTCPWTFKGTECGYAGEVYRNPISDITAEWTKSHLDANYKNVDDRLEDLTIGQTYTRSSVYGAGYEVGKAFDRDLVTYWYSSLPDDPQWVKVEFVTAKIINKAKLTQVSIALSPWDFVLRGSNDDIEFTDLLREDGMSWNFDAGFKQWNFTNNTAYKYYLCYFSKSNPAYHTGMAEIELFGPAGQVNDEDYNSTSLVAVSRYPTLDADHVKATTNLGASYLPHLTCDHSLLLTGTWAGKQWVTDTNEVTNQRFHIDLGVTQIIKLIYYENAHTAGAATNAGAENFTFWGSNDPDDFNELTYAVDGTWVQLTTSQSTLDQHVAADAPDPKYIVVTNTTPYRYYAFKFADNYGNSECLGVRRIELQTTDIADVFGISPLALAPEATNIVVTVRVRAKQTTEDERTLGGRIKYNGVCYDATPITPSHTDETDYDFIWTLNPATSAAWTPANIALIEGAGYFTPYDPDGHEISVSQCHLKVSNSITAMTCDLSPERCEELNNRDNFGGFAFISELQTKEYWWGSKQRIWSGGV